MDIGPLLLSLGLDLGLLGLFDGSQKRKVIECLGRKLKGVWSLHQQEAGLAET